MKIHQGYSGNVLFLILLAIGLFAALSYAVSDTNRGGSGAISDGRAKTLASEILMYGHDLKNAINYLISTKGCSENEISFQSSGWPNSTWYENPNAPSDFSCHIFDPRGAGISWKIIDGIYSGSGTEYGYPVIGTGGQPMRNFGRSNLGDLYLSVRHRENTKNYQANLSVCKHINKQMGIPDDPSSSFEGLRGFYRGSLMNAYKGAFDDTAAPAAIGSYFSNYNAFCAGDGIGYTRIIMPLYVR